MVQKVIWLAGARITFDDALKYLEENFTEKEIRSFTERINQKLDVLKVYPRIGKKSVKKNVYKTVIHKRIILIYRYKPLKNEIELLAFWNTLQDPKKSGI